MVAYITLPHKMRPVVKRSRIINWRLVRMATGISSSAACACQLL